MSFKAQAGLNLYKIDSKGKARFWQVTIKKEHDSLDTIRLTTTGILGGNSKVAEKIIKPVKGKTSWDRAVQMVKTQYKNKLRSGGYFEYLEDAEEFEPPKVCQLAKDLSIDELHKLPDSFFPCEGDIKLNGLRATYHRESGLLLSRAMIDFEKMTSVKADCASYCNKYDTDYIDVELFAPGFPINKHVSMVRHGDKRIKGYIFDLPDDKRTTFERKRRVRKFSTMGFDYLEAVLSYLLEDRESVRTFYDRACAGKEEGIIIRDRNMKYKWNNKTTRDNGLIKVKPLISAEFKVVGYEAEDRIIDSVPQKLVTFICLSETKQEFKVPPAVFGVEKRIAMYEDLVAGHLEVESLAPLSCEFREWTKTMKPFHIKNCYFRLDLPTT